MRYHGGLHFLFKTVTVYQFLYPLAVFGIGKIFAFAGYRHFYCFIFTFNHQYAVLFAYFNTVFDNDAFKNGFLIVTITAFYFEFLSRFKFGFAAYFK